MRAVPTSPSFCSFSSAGETTVSSCRMIDAVMYGMIPSANSEIRDRPPPLNVFSSCRTPPLPLQLLLIWSIASVLTPGTGMKEPSRYSARIAAVKTSFLRISATRNELRIVETTARLLLDELHRAARGLDALARGLRELVGVDRELYRQLAAAEDLDRDVALLGQAGRAQRLEIHRRAVGEARGQVVQVHVLHVGPERLERHRHLLVRPAQLAHAHVDRVLAALEARTVLGAGARAVALVAAPGGLAVARAVAAPDALAVALGARRGLEVVEADGLGGE